VRLQMPSIPCDDVWGVARAAFEAASGRFRPGGKQPDFEWNGRRAVWADGDRQIAVRGTRLTFDREAWSPYCDAYDHPTETVFRLRALVVGLAGRCALWMGGDEDGFSWLQLRGPEQDRRAALAAWVAGCNAFWMSRARWLQHPSEPAGWTRGRKHLQIWSPDDEPLLDGDPPTLRWRRGDLFWAVSRTTDPAAPSHFVGPVSGPAVRRLSLSGREGAALPPVGPWLAALSPDAPAPVLEDEGARQRNAAIGLLDTYSSGHELWKRWSAGPWVLRWVQASPVCAPASWSKATQSFLVQSQSAELPSLLGFAKSDGGSGRRLTLALLGRAEELEPIERRLLETLRSAGWS
jgi:hypothetical protein